MSSQTPVPASLASNALVAGQSAQKAFPAEDDPYNTVYRFQLTAPLALYSGHESGEEGKEMSFFGVFEWLKRSQGGYIIASLQLSRGDPVYMYIRCGSSLFRRPGFDYPFESGTVVMVKDVACEELAFPEMDKGEVLALVFTEQSSYKVLHNYTLDDVLEMNDSLDRALYPAVPYVKPPYPQIV